jgi:hypothetical protein
MDAIDKTTGILNSWKEIAAYLNRGVRTVQRWENELGLPVRRPRNTHRSPVIAMRSEIDEWIKSGAQKEEEQKPRLAVSGPSDSSDWRFLITEIGSGLTLVGIAVSARPEQTEKIHRCIREAYETYEAAVKSRSVLPADGTEGERTEVVRNEVKQLNADLDRLQDVVKQLGALNEFVPATTADRLRRSHAADWISRAG